jgi:membrane-anchored protein YejM (alkaline phosphatase superfamily)
LVGAAVVGLGLLGLSACGPGTHRPVADSLHKLPTRGRNLIVVLSDTHRVDHVSGPTGAEIVLTPRLEELAGQSVSFTNAYTPVPISAPAYATLMTGLRPVEHGLLNNEQRLGPELPLLQERLRDAGYRTAAVVGNPYCSAAHGFGRGFDHYWDEVDGRGKEGEIITDEAIRWLDTAPDDRPFFLFLAYMDAHTPYISDEIPPSLRVGLNGSRLLDARAENSHVEQRFPVELQPGRNVVSLTFLDLGEPALPGDEPSPLHLKDLRLASGSAVHRTSGVETVPGTGFERLANRAELTIDNPGDTIIEDTLLFRCFRAYRHERIPALYAAGVRGFDRAFGRLVDDLRRRGLYDNAVVVFVSDHGEMLGEHDAWGHVGHLHQQTMRVPLVVKAPGLEGGRTAPDRIDLRDLHDLILDMTIGADADRTATRRARVQAPMVGATFPPEAGRLQATAIGGGLKVIAGADGRMTAYDLKVDPGETDDIFDLQSGDSEIRALLDAALDELSAAREAESLDLGDLSTDERDRLRALGYLEVGD